jgi:hypothetical protein
MVNGGVMVATYQLKPFEMTDVFLRNLRDTFAGRAVSIRVEAADEPVREYRSADDCLVREGYTIPKGEENDPFYSAAHIRELNRRIANIEAGKCSKHELIGLEGANA